MIQDVHFEFELFKRHEKQYSVLLYDNSGECFIFGHHDNDVNKSNHITDVIIY